MKVSVFIIGIIHVRLWVVPGGPGFKIWKEICEEANRDRGKVRTWQYDVLVEVMEGI